MGAVFRDCPQICQQLRHAGEIGVGVRRSRSSAIDNPQGVGEMNQIVGQRQAELQQQLREMGREQVHFGQRLQELRRALGWTQRMAAVELGINVRTVIRHENGQHCTPRVRLPLLLKLRDLERVCAEEILVYLAHEEREHSWLRSVQHRLDG
jgi:DNA-binding XRE family transcriptional regulator